MRTSRASRSISLRSGSGSCFGVSKRFCRDLESASLLFSSVRSKRGLPFGVDVHDVVGFGNELLCALNPGWWPVIIDGGASLSKPVSMSFRDLRQHAARRILPAGLHSGQPLRKRPILHDHGVGSKWCDRSIVCQRQWFSAEWVCMRCRQSQLPLGHLRQHHQPMPAVVL